MPIITYCKIVNDQIFKSRFVDDADVILIPKLLAHGYQVAEDSQPSFDPDTQRITNEGLIVDNGSPKYKYIIWEDIRPDHNSLFQTVSLDNPEWSAESGGKKTRQYILTDNLSLDDAKTLKKQILKTEGIKYFQTKYDFLGLAKMLRSGTTAQFDSDYDAVEAHFVSKRNEVNLCSDLACIMSVTPNWPVI